MVTTVNVDVNGTTKEAVELRTVGTDTEVIFTDNLSAWDLKNLTNAEAESGSNLYDKLALITLPNGETGQVYYDRFSVLLNAYADTQAVGKGDIVTQQRFTASAAQTDYAINHNGLVQVFIDGVETEPADLTDRTKVVLGSATGGEDVAITVFRPGA